MKQFLRELFCWHLWKGKVGTAMWQKGNRAINYSPGTYWICQKCGKEVFLCLKK